MSFLQSSLHAIAFFGACFFVAWLISRSSSDSSTATAAITQTSPTTRLGSAGMAMGSLFHRYSVGATWVGIALALLFGLPTFFGRVSMTVDTQFLQRWKFSSDDPRWFLLAKRFIIKNEGLLGLNNVEMVCELVNVQYVNQPHVFVTDNIVASVSQTLDRLDSGSASTVECPSVEGSQIAMHMQPSKAWIAVVVSFRSDWALFHSVRKQTFLCGGSCPIDVCCIAPMFAPPPPEPEGESQ